MLLSQPTHESFTRTPRTARYGPQQSGLASVSQPHLAQPLREEESEHDIQVSTSLLPTVNPALKLEDPELDIEWRPGNSEPYECPICFLVQDTLEGHICHLDAHDKFMCSGAVHICVHCQQPFPRIRTLIRHISLEHPAARNGGITTTVSAREFLSFSRRHLPWWNSLLDLDIERPENVCEQNTAFEHLAAGCPKCGRVIRLFQLGSVGKVFGQWVLHMMKCHRLRKQRSPQISTVDRWLSSSSEDEGIPEDIIMENAASLSFPSPASECSSTWPEPDDDAVSVCDSTMSTSAASSRTSLHEDMYHEDEDNLSSSGRISPWQPNGKTSGSSPKTSHTKRKESLRLHRRREPVPRPRLAGKVVYPCTFCMSAFSNVGNARRHDREVHFETERYICGSYTIEDDSGKACLYCGTPYNLVKNEDGYVNQYGCDCAENAVSCRSKPIEDRTFYRKGHFTQHLKRAHGISQAPKGFLVGSKAVVNGFNFPQKSRCGFCNASFTSWQDRTEHIEKEFKHGRKMEEWNGDWGFGPEWADKLKGAILPMEREDVQLYRKRLSYWQPHGYRKPAWLEPS
ncbi:hypothetical protein FPQ18DRAFT_313274 [Pyronema domesticum]|uniref:C2H2-type domain-containing protein n=1 Tax=Pyronema omphalodes (strain CBS 100304) TaxID=1076935 RepID=U4L2N9_PYROM|nr:hypothetical protein FPQ18DRAFT_313274 [Pyronema domesticum]CCX10587.1 Similar to hypothetical protein NECHADRAFT_52280 [Nectria haematococca mpVI 77-13-4]; acc. no. XP_003042829 [Pyronema omphalodes CBS 100304]